jgi:hypothetical protein
MNILININAKENTNTLKTHTMSMTALSNIEASILVRLEISKIGLLPINKLKSKTFRIFDYKTKTFCIKIESIFRGCVAYSTYLIDCEKRVYDKAYHTSLDLSKISSTVLEISETYEEVHNIWFGEWSTKSIMSSKSECPDEESETKLIKPMNSQERKHALIERKMFKNPRLWKYSLPQNN